MKPFELFRNVAFVLVSFLFSASFVSCSDDETEEPPFDSETKQTILMYMPWSGSGIYTYFLNNISAFEQAVENNHGFDGNALMVFISENETRSNLIRIVYENGECRRDTLRQYIYSDCNYTTSAGIAEILNDAFSEAPAQSYALTVGCHGKELDVVHLGRDGKPEEKHLHHRHEQHDEHRAPVAQNMQGLFLDKM